MRNKMMDSKHDLIEPLSKRQIPMATNHVDRQDRKDRNSVKRNSVSSWRSRNKVHRVRKKDKEKGCVGTLKTLLQCYNVFILIIGCGVLGVGVWLLVKEFNTREMGAILDTNMIEFATYGLISGGAAATVLAFCGCCGTMKQEKFVLGFYGVVLTLVLLVLCVGLGLTFVFRDEITDDIKQRFEVSIIRQYGVEVNRNSTNRLITDAWDSMQRSLECCGAYGDVNGESSWSIYKRHSLWHKRYKPNGNVYVPESCCKDGQDKKLCQGLDNRYDGPPVYGPPMTHHQHKDNEALNTQGCFDKAVVYLEQHGLIITIVTASVPVLLLIGIVMAFYLCCKVKDDDDDDDEEEVEV